VPASSLPRSEVAKSEVLASSLPNSGILKLNLPDNTCNPDSTSNLDDTCNSDDTGKIEWQFGAQISKSANS
jgi:hypothetical protein